MPLSMVGWQLMKKLYQNDMVGGAENAVVYLHFILVQNKFACIGSGDSKSTNHSEKGSELLPNDWNKDTGNYRLRYQRDGKLYIVVVTNTGENILIDLIHASDLRVKSMIIPKSGLAALGDEGAIAKMYREILDDSPNGPFAVATGDVPRHKLLRLRDANPDRGRAGLFPDVGRRDLDPFGPFDPFGGMIYPMPGNMVPQQRRPRHDPVSPFPRFVPNPDADHFLPPGHPFCDFE